MQHDGDTDSKTSLECQTFDFFVILYDVIN